MMISAGNQAVHSYKTPRRLFYSLAAWSINDERALMSSKIPTDLVLNRLVT